jgi:hypothetical protein
MSRFAAPEEQFASLIIGIAGTDPRQHDPIAFDQETNSGNEAACSCFGQLLGSIPRLSLTRLAVVLN